MSLSAPTEPDSEAGPAFRFVLKASSALAIAGGALVLGLALLVTASVLRRWLTTRGIPGDFELAQMAMSVAIFAFLPICQLHGRNIVIDSFTNRLRRPIRAAIEALWALVYAAVAGLIAWQMALGGWQTLGSGTTTMVLGLPIGWAILAAAVLTFWLALVALVSVARLLLELRR